MRNGKGKRLAGPAWRHVIGVTGGFGSGKSTVVSFLRKKGATTLDADQSVHRALNNRKMQKKLMQLLGRQIVKNKVLNKKEVAQILFSSIALRRKTEQLIHPWVEKGMRNQLKRRRGVMAVCDVPLLYEAGWKNRFDQIVVVDAPLHVRIRRLKKKGFSKADITRRLGAQWPLKRKLKLADFVIKNGGSRHRTKVQVNRFWQHMTCRSAH